MKKHILTFILLFFLLAALICCVSCQNGATETSAPANPAADNSVETPAHEHSFGEWSVVEAATCTEDGSETRKCSCGETETRTIPAAGHEYVNGVCTVCGDKLVSEGLSFTLNEDGAGYSVSGIGTCKDTELFIPDVYEGKPVTSIAGSAFEDCEKLVSVTIPGSVTIIGNKAFSGCAGLTQVTIPEGVISIGKFAFCDCAGLTEVTIPASVDSIGEAAFANCSGIAALSVSAGNQKYSSAGNCIIETAAGILTAGCGASVIPTDGSVTSIGGWAFSGFSGITDLTIPESVTLIGECAFFRCTRLASVTIPQSVTAIGDNAFGSCSRLQTVRYAGSEEQWFGISLGESNDPLTDAERICGYMP